ncbi:MAG: alpha/beta hydrolase family protein [Myxococcota bacterium]|nr:alpha/beta hydrolase family protein [Myxococcota bacterium]
MTIIKSDGATYRGRAIVILAACLAILVGAQWVAWLVQTDFGSVEVTNVFFKNRFGRQVRAKLFRPHAAAPGNPVPGVVFVHGYQSVRETGDGICIELSRRGVVALSIDALGRGNSDLPGQDPEALDFDDTFGARAALAYVKSLPFVANDKVGMIGHSLGGGMSFKVALKDPTVRALVVMGYAYTTEVTPALPRNMLMIIGSYDEFRDRMTGARDIAREWMGTQQTKNAIPEANPEIGKTYGSFAAGTARKVLVPNIIHIAEPHHGPSIAAVLDWLRVGLGMDASHWKDTGDQIWSLREWATLIAMIACMAAVFPLCYLLLGLRFFSPLSGQAMGGVVRDRREYLKHATVNGLLMWLYLPATLIIFGIHKYVVRLDGAFPMMVVTATVFWFVAINAIGFLLFKKWYGRRSRADGLSLVDLGIALGGSGSGGPLSTLAKTAVLAGMLFGFVYLSEGILEAIFISDFRFVFAFASDLTPFRWQMFFLYLPPLLLGFLQLGFFLHCQLRTVPKAGMLQTFGSDSLKNLAVLLIPLVLLLAVQYLPLMTTGFIPFVGPGGMFVLFIINVFHIIGVLILVVPISTWCFHLTGRPYLGAMLCAAIVSWFFTSSQVIAPVPV